MVRYRRYRGEKNVGLSKQVVRKEVFRFERGFEPNVGSELFELGNYVDWILDSKQFGKSDAFIEEMNAKAEKANEQGHQNVAKAVSEIALAFPTKKSFVWLLPEQPKNAIH